MSDLGGGNRDAADLRSGRLVFVSAHHDEVVMVLDVDGHDLPVTVPLEPHTAHALRHVAALNGHTPGCRMAPDSSAGLLVRLLRAAKSVPLCVIVRPDPEPAFWLRLAGDESPNDVDLDVLEAVGLLLSRQFPVAVEVPSDDPWDRTLAALVADEGA